MADVLKPMFLVYSNGKRYTTKDFLLFRGYCDGKRNQTNALLFIPMANGIKPLFDLLFRDYCDGKRNQTIVGFVYSYGTRFKTTVLFIVPRLLRWLTQ